MRDLPIFEIEQRLLAAVAKQRRLIITAPTGSGKSTQVPQMLFRDDSQIVILQPRRLPTRMLAAWVAKDRGVKLGDEVGYQIRFDDVSSPRTRIRCTCGNSSTTPPTILPASPGSCRATRATR